MLHVVGLENLTLLLLWLLCTASQIQFGLYWLKYYALLHILETLSRFAAKSRNGCPPKRSPTCGCSSSKRVKVHSSKDYLKTAQSYSSTNRPIYLYIYIYTLPSIKHPVLSPKLLWTQDKWPVCPQLSAGHSHRQQTQDNWVSHKIQGYLMWKVNYLLKLSFLWHAMFQDGFKPLYTVRKSLLYFAC